MDTIAILLAIILPALLGSLWLGVFVPPATAARGALVWGNGLLIGLLAIPLLMRLLDGLGLPIDFLLTSSLVIALTVLAGTAQLYRRSNREVSRLQHMDFVTLSAGQKTLIVFLLVLLAIRLTSLGLELLWRPLFPWDATMHWATKARVWFEYGQIVPFVDNRLWIELYGDGVFTDHHPDYPITIPLLQVWMASAVGSWNESLVNVPWLLCLVALGAAFYGQLRASGASLTVSVVFTYMLLSMPLLNTHVALAGYADLFLGACYCAAIMAFHNWSMTRQTWQAVLAVFFAIACTLVKNEGFYWMLTFVPALVVVLLPGRRAVMLLCFLLLALSGVLILFPQDLSIAGHSLSRLNLHYRPEALAGIARSLWIHDNWHLLAYVLMFALPLGLISSRTANERFSGIFAALISAVGLFLVLFLFTRYAVGAVRLTAVGRISLHLVPALLYFLALLCSELSRQHRVNTPATAAPPIPD